MPLAQAGSDSLRAALISACPAQLYPHHPQPIHPVVLAPTPGGKGAPQANQECRPLCLWAYPQLCTEWGLWLLGITAWGGGTGRFWRQLVLDPQMQALGQAVITVGASGPSL